MPFPILGVDFHIEGNIYKRKDIDCLSQASLIFCYNGVTIVCLKAFYIREEQGLRRASDQRYTRTPVLLKVLWARWRGSKKIKVDKPVKCESDLRTVGSAQTCIYVNRSFITVIESRIFLQLFLIMFFPPKISSQNV